ncbi:MAG: hypothetical protein JRI34_03015 [Deltaproteobacteria bacterium]|nr:hypothetical protein [Deltaproteobacteria bacterium]
MISRKRNLSSLFEYFRDHGRGELSHRMDGEGCGPRGLSLPRERKAAMLTRRLRVFPIGSRKIMAYALCGFWPLLVKQFHVLTLKNNIP